MTLLQGRMSYLMRKLEILFSNDGIQYAEIHVSGKTTWSPEESTSVNAYENCNNTGVVTNTIASAANALVMLKSLLFIRI
jgi:hypothetical protein